MTLLEILWLVSVACLAVGAAVFADAVLDLHDVRRAHIGNGRRRYAVAQVRRESIRVVQLVLLVGFSWVALTNVNDLSGWGRQLAWLFLASQLLVVANALLDLYLNRRVRRWFARHLTDKELE